MRLLKKDKYIYLKDDLLDAGVIKQSQELEAKYQNEKKEKQLLQKEIEAKKKNIDFGETRRLYGEWNKENPTNKKVVYHKNYHSQGYGVYIVWDKKDAFFGNKYVMNFVLAKRQKMKLAKHLKENIKLINYINEY